MVTRKNRKSKKTSKRFRNKKVRKTRSKQQKGGNGKRKLNGNDATFLEEKNKKLENSINMGRLFGYRTSPEPKNQGTPAYVYTDPDGVIERQAKFNKDMEIEGEYIDAKEDGITFGGKITKR
jgi:hypothetical protein